MSGKKRILISGASGLLGSHVAQLLHESHALHLLVRTLPEERIDGATYHLCDFTADANSDVWPEAIDAVFHLAQSPHMREYPSKAREIHAVNAASTAALLDYAKRAGASHFVLASTGGLYAPSDAPLTEDSPIAVQEGPLGYYFETKRESEALVAAYADDFATIILRPFFMYGPGQTASMLIPRLIHSVREGLPITLQGEDGMRLNPLHVDDAVRALAATLGLEGAHTYNFAGPTPLTMRAIGEAIGAALCMAPVFTITDDSPPSLIADTTLMRRDLSCPTIAFKDGIVSMLHSPMDEAAHG